MKCVLFLALATAGLCLANGRVQVQRILQDQSQLSAGSVDPSTNAAGYADPSGYAMTPAAAASPAQMDPSANPASNYGGYADPSSYAMAPAAAAPDAAPEGSAYAEQAASSAEPAPSEASMASSTPSSAPAPGLAAAYASKANLVATVVGTGVAFAPPDFVEITGVAPVVPFYSTEPVWRAGSWNLTQFASPDLTIGQYWLGAPDGVIFGNNENGTQVALVLGPIMDPSYNTTNQTLRFRARPITKQADIGLAAGIATYAANANGPLLLRQAPTTSLTEAVLSIDMAVLPTKNTTARTTYQEVGLRNKVQKVKTTYEVDTVNPADLAATPLSASEQKYLSAAPPTSQ